MPGGGMPGRGGGMPGGGIPIIGGGTARGSRHSQGTCVSRVVRTISSMLLMYGTVRTRRAQTQRMQTTVDTSYRQRLCHSHTDVTLHRYVYDTKDGASVWQCMARDSLPGGLMPGGIPGGGMPGGGIMPGGGTAGGHGT